LRSRRPSDKWCTFTCGGSYSDSRHNVFLRHTLDALDAVLRDDSAAAERLNNLKRDRNLKEIRGPGVPTRANPIALRAPVRLCNSHVMFLCGRNFSMKAFLPSLGAIPCLR